MISDPKSEAQLRQLNAELAEAEVLRDVEALERLISTDYLGIDPSGSLLTKERIINTYGSGKVMLDSIITSDLRIRVFDNTGIITGRSLINGRSGLNEFNALFRYTDTYRKEGKGWQLISSQLTPLLSGDLPDDQDET